jgi:Ni,Fe-hydrogenase III component G
MNLLETIPEKLGTKELWTEKGRVHWLACDGLSVRNLAQTMVDSQARFITITASQLAGDDGIRLEYHWDLDGELLGFTLLAANNQIESIYDLCEAADWIEREVHEYFAVDFIGRAYEPLMLRGGEKAGVNLREGSE